MLENPGLLMDKKVEKWLMENPRVGVLHYKGGYRFYIIETPWKVKYVKPFTSIGINYAT